MKLRRWAVALLTAGLGACLAASCAAEVVVLQVAPWTGARGEAGWNAHVGTTIAFDELNAGGGIQGQKLRLVLEAEDAEHLDRQVRGLVQQWNPVALVGLVGASPLRTLQQGQVLGGLQLPAIGVTSGAPSLRQLAGPPVYATRAGQQQEMLAIFQHLATVRATRATMVLADDKEADALQALAREYGQRLGIEIVNTIVFSPERDGIDTVVARTQAVEHHAVIVAADTAPTAEFCRLYKLAGGKAQIASLSTAEPARLASFGGKAAARGVMFALAIPNPRQRNVPLVHEYLDAFKRFGPAGVSPTVAMFESYIAARVLIEALKQTGPAAGRAALARYFGSTQTVWISGHPVHLQAGAGAAKASLTMLDMEGKMLW